jgi:glycosyltransferase involved in cell wall biosynthesis
MLGHSLLFPDKATRQIPNDIAVIHYPLTLPFPSFRRPRVVTLHDVVHHDLPHFFSRAQRRWRKHVYDDSARSATLVVTPCDHAKRRAVETLGLDPSRIEVIPLGIDHGLYSPRGADDERILRPLRVPRRFLLYPAALLPHKNHFALIDAMARLDDKEIELVLTGPSLGNLRRLHLRAHERGVGERVRHLGFVSGSQLAALYRSATLMVFPSLYEGFGAPSIEAMACGCPVVASRSGALPEVCGDAAAYYDAMAPEDIAESIRVLLADSSKRSMLSSRGIQRARVFTWRAAASRHAMVYRRAALEGRDQTDAAGR